MSSINVSAEGELEAANQVICNEFSIAFFCLQRENINKKLCRIWLIMQSFYVLVARFKTTWRIWVKCWLFACVEETKMFQYEFCKELFFFTSSHSEAFSFANLGFSMNFFKLMKLGILWSWRKHNHTWLEDSAYQKRGIFYRVYECSGNQIFIRNNCIWTFKQILG